QYIDYGKIYNSRIPLLKKAFSKFDKSSKEFKAFLRKGKYKDYALFKTILELNGYKPFYDWEDKLKYRDKDALNKVERENRENVLFWQFVQFESEREWLLIKKYANANGIKIFGDMPLYVSGNSVDVWTKPFLFDLDDRLYQRKVAGVPPDYFCSEGQLWGNPVYNYEYQKKDNFSWWVNRIKDILHIFDYVRIDHFRGLDRFYQVDSGSVNAKYGEWVDVPSKELFTEIFKVINKDRIIAEDLGIIDDGVRDLLKYTGLPGMKVLSFAFNNDSKNPYLPKNIEENSVCYTGTHDNDTLLGLIDSFNEWDKNNFILGVKSSLKELKIKQNINGSKNLAKAVIEFGFSSKSKLFVLPVWDLCLYDSNYRINKPGTVNNQNWAVRFDKSIYKKSTIEKLKILTKKYKR
ncbi:MAG: 4-alpha-glucanotransferase, partial [Firmicutes bacterium]|nr:4-alpha-glucanotransferase [Candidatus Caballimonas caccae]